MGKTITRSLLLAALMLTHNHSVAGIKTMTVIHDGGGVSIAPYLQNIQAEDQTTKPQIKRPISISDPRSAALPVKTPELTPGRLSSTFIPKQISTMSTPIAIIGADEISYRWLQANQNTLRKLGATGIVVNVSSVDQLEHLESASGIRMSPVNGAEFSRIWGIKNYPVLITSSGVHQ